MNQAARLYLFRGAELLVPSGPAGHAHGEGLLESLPFVARRDYPAGGLACTAARLDPDADPGLLSRLGLQALAFRSAMAELPWEEASRAAKGLALLNWLEVSRMCGACGTALVDDSEEGWESGARRCPSCHRLFFPKVSPAVIILVEKEGKILLAHNASFPADRFGLIAGFVEPGESIEETARRELKEEASIEVSSLNYVSSQPWPFPDSLMLAFDATWASGESKPDGKEITELRWCGPEELPAIPPPGSVARRLIDAWLARSAVRCGSCGGSASA